MSDRSQLPGWLIRLALLAGAFGLITFLSPAAFSQDSGSSSDGSETEGQEVSVSGGNSEGGTSSSEGGSTCSGGSEVTVVTDEGTSHPSSGGTCRADPVAPTTQQRLPSSASTTTTQPSPTPEALATTPPAVAQTSPLVTLPERTPRSNAVAADRSGTLIPLVLTAVAIALAAGGYLIMSGFKGVFRRITKRPSRSDTWGVAFIEDASAVRILPRTSDPSVDLVPPPPPTEPIPIVGGDTGADVIATQDSSTSRA